MFSSRTPGMAISVPFPLDELSMVCTLILFSAIQPAVCDVGGGCKKLPFLLVATTFLSLLPRQHLAACGDLVTTDFLD